MNDETKQYTNNINQNQEKWLGEKVQHIQGAKSWGFKISVNIYWTFVVCYYKKFIILSTWSDDCVE